MPVRRICLACGQPQGTNNCNHIRTYPHKVREQMRATVKQWKQQHGDYCPGYGMPPHRASDLTADHVIPWSLNPTPTNTKLTVLCRACNGRKGNRA